MLTILLRFAQDIVGEEQSRKLTNLTSGKKTSHKVSQASVSNLHFQELIYPNP